MSEREKIGIIAKYYSDVVGDLEKSNQIWELQAENFPRSGTPHLFLSRNYASMGLYEKGLSETLEGIRKRSTPFGYEYGILMGFYMDLNRLAEAKAVYQQVLARKLDAPFLHLQAYLLGFLEGDAAEMNRQFAAAAGKLGEDMLISTQSDTQAYCGRLEKARELSRRAEEINRRSDQKETAAKWLIDAALREVEIGNPERARETTAAALGLAPTGYIQTVAALAFARAGDSVRAQKMEDDLAKAYPRNTMLTVMAIGCPRSAPPWR